MRELIASLDSDIFCVRERSARELEALGHAGAPALGQAVAAGPSVETAPRIEQLLGRKPDAGSRPDQLRRLRAMQVLERVGTPLARRLLSDLAGAYRSPPRRKRPKPLSPAGRALQGASATGQAKAGPLGRPVISNTGAGGSVIWIAQCLPF